MTTPSLPPHRRVTVAVRRPGGPFQDNIQVFAYTDADRNLTLVYPPRDGREGFAFRVDQNGQIAHPFQLPFGFNAEGQLTDVPTNGVYPLRHRDFLRTAQGLLNNPDFMSGETDLGFSAEDRRRMFDGITRSLASPTAAPSGG